MTVIREAVISVMKLLLKHDRCHVDQHSIMSRWGLCPAIQTTIWPGYGGRRYAGGNSVDLDHVRRWGGEWGGAPIVQADM
jgi:hypothetical protein